MRDLILSLVSLGVMIYVLMVVFQSYGIVGNVLNSWLIVMLPLSTLFLLLAFDGLRNEDFEMYT